MKLTKPFQQGHHSPNGWYSMYFGPWRSLFKHRWPLKIIQGWALNRWICPASNVAKWDTVQQNKNIRWLRAPKIKSTWHPFPRTLLNVVVRWTAPEKRLRWRKIRQISRCHRSKKSTAKRKKTITSGNKLKSKDQMLDNKAEIAFRLLVQLIPVPD